MEKFLDVLANVIVWMVCCVVTVLLVLCCLEQPLVILAVVVLSLCFWAWERSGKL